MAKRKKFVAATEVDEESEETVAEVGFADDETITDNAHEVPMFADIDGRTSRSITKLRITKIEAGKPPAYKGTVATTATLDTIGQLFGDGIYMIEGLNNRHVTLAVKENIHIALTPEEDKRKQLEMPFGHGDADRIERMAREAAAESQTRSDAFLQLLTTTFTATTERERLAHEANMKMMTGFFAAMMSQQQQGFQQTITMMTTGHNMTLRELDAVERNRESRKLPKPADDSKMLESLIKGMKLATDLQKGTGDERPAWEQILSSGLGILSAAKTAETAAPVGVAPTPALAPGKRPPRILTTAQKKRIARAVRFYESVRARGIDPDDLLQRLSEAGPPSEESEPEADESEDSDLDEDSDDSDDTESDELSEDDEESDDSSGAIPEHSHPVS